MRRPIDPRHHGLKEPVQEITKYETIHLELAKIKVWSENTVKLSTIVDAWNKALKDHLSQGHRIVEPPVLVAGQRIQYQIGWTNQNYETELADYNRQVAQYEVELANFLTFEELKATLPAEHPKAIELKIERTKQRLANLEAMRDHKPLPFP